MCQLVDGRDTAAQFAVLRGGLAMGTISLWVLSGLFNRFLQRYITK
jgi:hypothetical protein